MTPWFRLVIYVVSNKPNKMKIQETVKNVSGSNYIKLDNWSNKDSEDCHMIHG